MSQKCKIPDTGIVDKHIIRIILRKLHGSIIKRLKRSMSNKVSVYAVSLGKSLVIGVGMLLLLFKKVELPIYGIMRMSTQINPSGIMQSVS